MEFKKGNQFVYVMAGKLGIRNEACAHMKSGYIRFTKDIVKKEALKYNRKTDFVSGSRGAYDAARKNGWLDEVCEHMVAQYKTWTHEEVRDIALQYKHKVDFQKGNYAAYGYAYRQGIFDDICSHMTKLTTTWTPDRLREEALKFETRNELKMATHDAYRQAINMGMMDEICAHMTKVTTVSDNDAIYIWKVIGIEENGLPVYKIGTTSARLGDKRIKDTIAHSGFDGDMIILAQLKIRATIIEGQIHDMGKEIDIGRFEGYSEFRALSDTSLSKAIDLITSNSR